jgi:hypothetical protein
MVPVMTLFQKSHHRAWALGLALPPLVALAIAAMALAPPTTGPVCAEVPETAAQPALDLLEGPAQPHPACIRVQLSAAR